MSFSAQELGFEIEENVVYYPVAMLRLRSKQTKVVFNEAQLQFLKTCGLKLSVAVAEDLEENRKM